MTTTNKGIDLNRLKELAQAAKAKPGETVWYDARQFEGYATPEDDVKFIVACTPDAILELIALAERAARPSEAGVDTAELSELLRTLCDKSTPKIFDMPTKKSIIAHIEALAVAARNDGAIEGRIHQRGVDEAKIAAAREEGRRQGFNPDWDKVEPLQESLREHMALVAELRQRAEQAERERGLLAQAIADAAQKAGVYNGEVDLTGPHLLMLASDLAEQALAARQAPDLLKVTDEMVEAAENTGDLYRLGQPELIRNAIRNAILAAPLSSTAQPLQQEGGKIRGYLTPGNEWMDFHSTLESAQAACEEHNAYERTSPDWTPEDDWTPEAVYCGPQPSDNLQQASTAQAAHPGNAGVEPANDDLTTYPPYDQMRWALEQIAVGDAKFPRQRAVDVLVASGLWSASAITGAATTAEAVADKEQYDREARRLVSIALGLGGEGLNDGKPVTFSWGYLLDSIRALAAPAQATPEGADLPPLPYTNYNGYSDGSEPLYTADQMRDYARAALAAQTLVAAPKITGKPPKVAVTTAAEPVGEVVSVDNDQATIGLYDTGLVVRGDLVYRAAPPQQVDTNGMPG